MRSCAPSDIAVKGEQYVFETDGDTEVRFFDASDVVGVVLVTGRVSVARWRFVLNMSITYDIPSTASKTVKLSI